MMGISNRLLTATVILKTGLAHWEVDLPGRGRMVSVIKWGEQERKQKGRGKKKNYKYGSVLRHFAHPPLMDISKNVQVLGTRYFGDGEVLNPIFSCNEPQKHIY